MLNTSKLQTSTFNEIDSFLKEQVMDAGYSGAFDLRYREDIKAYGELAALSLSFEKLDPLAEEQLELLRELIADQISSYEEMEGSDFETPEDVENINKLRIWLVALDDPEALIDG